MASILKRGPRQWQAIIRKKGHKSQTRTFETKGKAEAWASVIESEMVRNVFVDRTELERTTLGDLLNRYGDEVCVAHRSYRTEMVTIRRFLRHDLSVRSLASLRTADFTSYLKEREGEQASNNSIRLEFALLSAMFNHARKAWSIPIQNPINDVTLPSPGKGRERRLEGDEEERLLAAARLSRAPSLELCIILAIETGLRAGNIVELRWEQIDFAEKLINVGRTKNGGSIAAPLSEAALSKLLAYSGRKSTGRITAFSGSEGLGASFRVACAKAEIVGLHFHDLRHEAASRLAPYVTAPTLKALMGWKTLAMVQRYYNPKKTELREARLAAEAARQQAAAKALVQASLQQSS